MSFISGHVHLVFCTKGRENILVPQLRKKLFSYIEGIAEKNKIKILAIGGIEDHIHMLVGLRSTMPMAKVAQLIKGNSSKWINDTFPEYRHFSWQKEYGGFNVSGSHLDPVAFYVRNQEEHHKVVSFDDEFKELLKKNCVQYEESYIFSLSLEETARC